MKHYKIRPGIVKIKICGVPLLVPTREASEKCPKVLRMNMIADLSWGILEKYGTEEGPLKIKKMFLLLSKVSDEEAEKKTEKILADFCEGGFLIVEEDV